MAGISSKASGSLTNKFKYNGKEEQAGEFSDGSGLGMYDYGARMYDYTAPHWIQMDPHTDAYSSFSPYDYCLNNPISTIDPDGRDPSTHTDEQGDVVAVFNDGDNGVYKHNGSKEDATKEVNANHSEKNTGAGGTKMGETQYWDEFANHDANGNIVGNKNGNFANTDARIFFGQSKDEAMKYNIQMVSTILNALPDGLSAKKWLADNSGPGKSLDIKVKIGGANGYLFNGKYVTGESLGNYFFGANLESLRNSTILDNLRYPSDNKLKIFDAAAHVFGALQNSSNHVNNPTVAPYYGEIPYSGRQVVLGYWNNSTANPIFNNYSNTAVYGNIKIK